MKIVWDEPKRIANLDKHGLDFAALDVDFFYGATVLPAKVGRLKAIGSLDDEIVSVIFMPLGREALAIISMRPAGKSEKRQLYGKTKTS